MVIEKAQRETRFSARAARIDSTVVEADIRYPSDAMLALQGARVLAREGRKLARLIRGKTVRVRDRSRSVGQNGPGDLEDARQAHRRGEGAGDGAQPAGRPDDRALRQGGQASGRAARANAAAAARKPSCEQPRSSTSSPRAAARWPSRSTGASAG